MNMLSLYTHTYKRVYIHKGRAVWKGDGFNEIELGPTTPGWLSRLASNT